MKASASFTLILTLLSACTIQGCVFLFGESPAALVDTEWNYGFRGDDWDKAGWVCLTGTRQSPINIGQVSQTLIGSPVNGLTGKKSTWSYTPTPSNGSNIEIYNNGHTIQVQWARGVVQSNVRFPADDSVVDVLNPSFSLVDITLLPLKTAIPLQLHFHTTSEHTVNGVYYPLEMHIVHLVTRQQVSSCPDSGCFMVTGINFVFTDADQDNPALNPIFSNMPLREGAKAAMPAGVTFNIEALFPANREYVQYEGSLTTPPCSQGLLWQVLTNPVPISTRQYKMFAAAVGLKQCTKDGVAAQGHRRLLHNHGLADANDTLAKAPGFVRGSYAGPFVLDNPQSVAAQHRALLQADADSYQCTVKSLGFTNRNIQPRNGRRVVKWN